MFNVENMKGQDALGIAIVLGVIGGLIWGVPVGGLIFIAMIGFVLPWLAEMY